MSTAAPPAEVVKSSPPQLQLHHLRRRRLWDPAWRVVLNPGRLKPEFSVDDRTDALVSLEIDRKEDLELLVNGAAFASGEAHNLALAVLYRLFGTDQLILLQQALQQSAAAAEQLAGQAVIPAPGGPGRRAKRHHYELPVVPHRYLKRADGEVIVAFRIVEHHEPHGKLDATFRALVPEGVDPAVDSTWLCPATPCCKGTAHFCIKCKRRHYRHKQNMMVMVHCAYCWNREACQPSNQREALAEGVGRPDAWPEHAAVTEASGYWFGFV
ncbi:hypothetical protein B484DRAFT_473475 [Ochromonadaceae sp. CCMP2298]|nr:hypothetical protein B484DRAFT_473475 [Ochromonadaceae sp. CCMP2298]